MDVRTRESRAGIRRKLRRKRHKLLIIKLLHDFAKNTTLHGLRYITDRTISLVEKIFWIVTFLISLILCLYLIRNVWVKWQTSPIIVALSEHLVSVQEVPFPSVTICPQIKAKRSVYNFSTELVKMMRRYYLKLDHLTQDEQPDASMYEDISILCSTTEPFEVPMRNYSDNKIIENIYKVSPTVDDIFISCKWHMVFVDCKTLFEPVLTMEGLCFTMNSLAASEIFKTKSIQHNYNYLNTSKSRKSWSPTEGYTNSTDSVYPRRGRGNGAIPDLQIILQETLKDIDGLCNGLNHGYRVYLQNTADMPQSSLYYYSTLPRHKSSFALKLSIMNTSSSLLNYPPETRQCYFPEERHLRYFRIYTPNNCRLECLSNYTFDFCGCVWFHMPYHNSSMICRRAKRSCVFWAIEKFAFEQGNSDSDASTAGCSCLPSCVGIQYDAEVLHAQFDATSLESAFVSVFSSGQKPGYYQQYTLTQIELYYKESRFVSMRRSELFGLTDFLANCGGLLGLFLGFSFLSLVEIIYFLTLRFGFTLGRDMPENVTSGTEEEVQKKNVETVS